MVSQPRVLLKESSDLLVILFILNHTVALHSSIRLLGGIQTQPQEYYLLYLRHLIHLDCRFTETHAIL